LIEEFHALIAGGDMGGAEELLSAAFGRGEPREDAFLHLQMAKLYQRWNKLSSAVNHLHRAVELAADDRFLKLQIVDELASTRRQQELQRP
jgi:hypothetical protein